MSSSSSSEIKVAIYVRTWNLLASAFYKAERYGVSPREMPEENKRRLERQEAYLRYTARPNEIYAFQEVGYADQLPMLRRVFNEKAGYAVKTTFGGGERSPGLVTVWNTKFFTEDDDIVTLPQPWISGQSMVNQSYSKPPTAMYGAQCTALRGASENSHVGSFLFVNVWLPRDADLGRQDPLGKVCRDVEGVDFFIVAGDFNRTFQSFTMVDFGVMGSTAPLGTSRTMISKASGAPPESATRSVDYIMFGYPERRDGDGGGEFAVSVLDTPIVDQYSTRSMPSTLQEVRGGENASSDHAALTTVVTWKGRRSSDRPYASRGPAAAAAAAAAASSVVPLSGYAVYYVENDRPRDAVLAHLKKKYSGASPRAEMTEDKLLVPKADGGFTYKTPMPSTNGARTVYFVYQHKVRDSFPSFTKLEFEAVAKWASDAGANLILLALVLPHSEISVSTTYNDYPRERLDVMFDLRDGNFYLPGRQPRSSSSGAAAAEAALAPPLPTLWVYYQSNMGANDIRNLEAFLRDAVAYSATVRRFLSSPKSSPPVQYLLYAVRQTTSLVADSINHQELSTVAKSQKTTRIIALQEHVNPMLRTNDMWYESFTVHYLNSERDGSFPRDKNFLGISRITDFLLGR